MIEYRAAQDGEQAAIRDLQIASWRRAYRGMLSDAFLDGAVFDVLDRRWAVLPGPDWMVETAWSGRDLLGFLALQRDHAGGPYVDNLHVAARGQGIGRQLMARVAGQLAGEGQASMWLTVIRENAPTRAFYAALGGQEGPEQDDLLFGQPLVSLPVRWHDLPGLATRGGG